MKEELLKELGLEQNTLDKIKDIFEQENPFNKPVNVPKYEIIKDDRVSLAELNQTIQPFLTQLTLANNRIHDLVAEKAELAFELRTLKDRELELEEALDFSYNLIQEKEEVIINQEIQIEELLKKANKKWWKFWD